MDEVNTNVLHLQKTVNCEHLSVVLTSTNDLLNRPSYDCLSACNWLIEARQTYLSSLHFRNNVRNQFKKSQVNMPQYIAHRLNSIDKNLAKIETRFNDDRQNIFLEVIRLSKNDNRYFYIRMKLISKLKTSQIMSKHTQGILKSLQNSLQSIKTQDSRLRKSTDKAVSGNLVTQTGPHSPKTVWDKLSESATPGFISLPSARRFRN